MFEDLLPINAETPAHVEKNENMKHEIQHVPLKCDPEEVKMLQETDPHYAKLIKNMKMKNKISKDITA